MATPQCIYVINKLSKTSPGGKQVLKDLTLAFPARRQDRRCRRQRRGQVHPAPDQGRAGDGIRRRGLGGRGGQRRLSAARATLEDFPGYAVIISHDRFFLDRIATYILSLATAMWNGSRGISRTTRKIRSDASATARRHPDRQAPRLLRRACRQRPWRARLSCGRAGRGTARVAWFSRCDARAHALAHGAACSIPRHHRRSGIEDLDIRRPAIQTARR